MITFPEDLIARLEALHERRRRRLLEEAKRAVFALIQSGVLREHGAQAAVFGSFARGDYGEHSDLDLVLIDAERPYELVGKILGLMQETSKIPVDVVILEESPEYLKQRIEEEGVDVHRFVKEA